MAAEARLSTLFDDSTSLLYDPSLFSSLNLPPLQDPFPPCSSDRPSPLEPNADVDSSAHPSTSHLPSSSSGAIITNPPLSSNADVNSFVKITTDGDGVERAESFASTVLQGPAADTSSRQALHSAHTEATQLRPASSPRKRPKLGGAASSQKSFVQLPQPPPKRKSHSSQIPSVTRVRELKAPPFNVPLFPPITPNDFERADSTHSLLSLSTILSTNKEIEDNSILNDEEPAPSPKSTRKPTGRPRKKWTDQETQDLLQGVRLYGIGNWRKILEHPEYDFNARNSIDLKDRFRTCCPEEYRLHQDSPRTPTQAKTSHTSTAPSLLSIPLSSTPPSTAAVIPAHTVLSSPKSSSPGTTSPQTGNPSQCQRLQTLDLAHLGITGPFPKTSRRGRRPFTEAEDANLLRGYLMHGPQWSKIQTDLALDLHSRRATDLRDRFRNRFPKKYAEAGFKPRPKGVGRPTPPRTRGRRSVSQAEKESRDRSPSPLEAAEVAFETVADPAYKERRETLPSTANLTSQLDNPLIDWDDNTLPPFAGLNSSNVANYLDPDLQRLLLDNVPPLLTYNPSSSSNPRQNPSLSPTPQSTTDLRANHVPYLFDQPQQQQQLPQIQNATPNARTSSANFSTSLPPPGDLFATTLPTLSTPLDYDPIPGLVGMTPCPVQPQLSSAGASKPATATTTAQNSHSAADDATMTGRSRTSNPMIAGVSSGAGTGGGGGGGGAAGSTLWDEMTTHPIFDTRL
ncbi:MAG: hypothetical protein M1837_000327 [Sclerophora amabilis]|nr:MAG: hypothetical protein M1837_000327 [Sclerophora amabilis]